MSDGYNQTSPLYLGLDCKGLSRTPAAQFYFAFYQGFTLEKLHLKKNTSPLKLYLQVPLESTFILTN